MRLKIESIKLNGAEREYFFSDGLNIITGPMSSGKTTLIRCINVIFGGEIKNFPKESKDTIRSLGSSILIGNKNYKISRPFVSTKDAFVDIYGDDNLYRLPATLIKEGYNLTYKNWLLEKLNLPILNVRNSTTNFDVETSPVTINDYLMYCYLKQKEINNSVFGHNEYFKNNKRKYVFDILYGKYNIQIASLEEEKRKITKEIYRLESKNETLNDFLKGTSFENKVLLETKIEELEKELIDLQKNNISNSKKFVKESSLEEYKNKNLNVELEISDTKKKIIFEKNSIQQLEQLSNQLITQSKRITKSIVSDNYLLDFDFIICPRCGSSINESRTDEHHCYLCLSPEKESIERDDLIKEQDRLDKQIIETKEIISGHYNKLKNLKRNLEQLLISKEKNNNFIFNFSSIIFLIKNSYISPEINNIVNQEYNRAKIENEIIRLGEFLNLLNKNEDIYNKINILNSDKDEIEIKINNELSNSIDVGEKISYLDEKMNEILEIFDHPNFYRKGFTGIDKNTYLPIFEGKKFDEIQSPGLIVLLNIAHLLAHQEVSLKYPTNLPNIVIIDGISGNMGYEGLDLQRINKIFEYLIFLSDSLGDKIQIIVAENTIPEFAKKYIVAEFSEEDKIIPDYLL